MSASNPARSLSRDQGLAVATAFLALFSVVGIALYGLPRFYPFYVEELGWTRQQVTSGNAYSKIIVALLFGFIAGRIVDVAGPRRVMLVGIVMAGGALIGLSYVTSLTAFYLFYGFNALGYVCGGPLPNQVLLSRWFDRARGKAMGVAYLGIGVGGTCVPLLAYTLTQSFGWRGALRILGVLMILIAFPVAYFVREPAASTSKQNAPSLALTSVMSKPAFYFLMIGSMASIGAVGGTMQNLALYLRLDRQLAAGDDRHHAVVDSPRQPRRPAAHGLAGRSLAEETRHVVDLSDRRRRDPAALLCADASSSEPLRVSVRHRAWRRLHDHPADGGGDVWRRYHGPGHGGRAHG